MAHTGGWEGGKLCRWAGGNDHDIVYHQVQFLSDDAVHVSATRKRTDIALFASWKRCEVLFGDPFSL